MLLEVIQCVLKSVPICPRFSDSAYQALERDADDLEDWERLKQLELTVLVPHCHPCPPASRIWK